MNEQHGNKPLNHATVTVLTPVYNGAEYLPECIESVLAQSYRDWNYIIVNNKSTDDTLRIAQSYAAKDDRISVVTPDAFVSMPSNFNRAFGMVPEDAKYVKVVCADDWLMPTCLEELVRLAESHPKVGIVGCYQQSGPDVRWRDLPSTVEVLSGREACRKVLLEGAQLFGAPTAFLYRAELMREGKPFFPNDRPYSDTSACFEKLDHWDFGMVHKILSAERVHEGQITSQISDVAPGDLAYVEAVKDYGPRYLSEVEYSERLAEAYSEFTKGLGRGLLNFRGRKFWDFQKTELNRLGLRLNYGLVVLGAVRSAWSNALTPGAGARKLKTSLAQRFGR